MPNSIRPSRIRLDVSSACQLKCPLCPHATGEIERTVGTGYVRVDDFLGLLERNPWVSEVELSNLGELFLSPDILGIMKHAHERGVALTADTGVNLNTVSDDVLEGLVKHRFRRMTCSIDGASDEVYEVYRVGGDFHRVIAHIETLNRFKKKHRSKRPIVTWQFIVFGHNEHEIPAARRLASQLDMDFSLKTSWDPDYAPVRDREFVREQHRKSATAQCEHKEKQPDFHMRVFCHQLWEEPQINWDGRVLGCCCNWWLDFGSNAFTDGLFYAVNSERMKYAREMLLGRKPARDDIPCSTCAAYIAMKSTGKWLERGVSRRFYRAARSAYRALGLRRVRQQLGDALSFQGWHREAARR